MVNYNDFFTNFELAGRASRNSVHHRVFLDHAFGNRLGYAWRRIGSQSPETCAVQGCTIMALLISPMVVPLIISAAGMYFFYSRKVGLASARYLGIILAHAPRSAPPSSSSP